MQCQLLHEKEKQEEAEVQRVAEVKEAEWKVREAAAEVERLKKEREGWKCKVKSPLDSDEEDEAGSPSPKVCTELVLRPDKSRRTPGTNSYAPTRYKHQLHISVTGLPPDPVSVYVRLRPTHQSPEPA
ncbi:hypothetical protein BU17DRAFT_82337 [Hysterangium stoloniferum]|nr:hypothetical protein BU17DRAFT_82337 [Hysterangium stoloniferum]